MRRAVLPVALLAGFSLIAGQPAIAGHIEDTYEAIAENNNGITTTSTTVCLRFNDPNPGDLTLDAFPPPPDPSPPVTFLLTYRHQELNTNLRTFQAVTRGDAPGLPEIMVFGTFKSGGRKIFGEGLNEDGTTHTFFGQKNNLCGGK